jgi:hypothetical protein
MPSNPRIFRGALLSGALACLLIGAAAMGPHGAGLEGRWYSVTFMEGVEADVPRADRGTCEAIAALDGSVCVFGAG